MTPESLAGQILAAVLTVIALVAARVSVRWDVMRELEKKKRDENNARQGRPIK